MATEQKIKTSSKEILDIIGGKDNIISAAHCATRLRLVLKDESIVDLDRLSDVEIVKGYFSNSGQFQIIIGSGTVDEVYKEIIGKNGITASVFVDFNTLCNFTTLIIAENFPQFLN